MSWLFDVLKLSTVTPLPIMAADTITITVTGQAAATKAGRRITAEAGSFTVTGRAAALRPAKKLAANVVVSSELNEDSVISIGEMIARSVAQTFANEED
jgi:hypothetical protein